MYCRSPIPFGGRVYPNLSSGCSFSRSQSSLGRLERGALSGIWTLALHPRCLGHGGIQRAEGTGGSVGRSVIPQVRLDHLYLTGPLPGQGLGQGRIKRAQGTGVSIGWSVYSSGEMVRFTLPRWELGVAWIRRARCHAPPPRPMVNGFSHWSGDELVRRFCICGLVQLNTISYGWVRWDTVRFG